MYVYLRSHTAMHARYQVVHTAVYLVCRVVDRVTVRCDGKIDAVNQGGVYSPADITPRKTVSYYGGP